MVCVCCVWMFVVFVVDFCVMVVVLVVICCWAKCVWCLCCRVGLISDVAFCVWLFLFGRCCNVGSVQTVIFTCEI